MSGQRFRFQLRWFAVWFALGLCVLAFAVRTQLSADNIESETSVVAPISVSADYASEGKSEDGQRVLILRGHCRIQQASTIATAQKAVIFQTSASNKESLALYLEDDVHVEQVGQSDQQPNAFLQLNAPPNGVASQFRFRSTNENVEQDALYPRAVTRRRTAQRSTLTQTQFVVPSQEQPTLSLPTSPASDSLRRVRISPRNSTSFQLDSKLSDKTVPAEQVTTITGGVNVVIEGIKQFDVIDLSADNVVIWTEGSENGQFNFDSVQTQDTPYQVYLEGNIVVRQGYNVLKAERAYYDAREDRGLMLDADLAVKAPELQGAQLRVKAERLRQNSRNEFHASNAWATTSQFGKPGYRIQASDIFVEPYYAESLQLPRVGEPFTANSFDPSSTPPKYREVPYVTSLNNTFILDEYPLFYLPYVAAPADATKIPLRSLTFQSDRVFGQQVRSTWDILQIFGISEPEGTTLNFNADYLSKRGPGLGLDGKYLTNDFLGIPGTAFGDGLGYYIYDGGADNLGLDRRQLDPLENNRGRFNWRHQQTGPYGFKFIGEAGLLSDRNFLEQFYESEFDTGKDVESLVNLTQTQDNWQWGLLARTTPMEFENNTAWLPRGDFTFLGEPLLGGWLSWSSHSMAGYAQLNQADTPNIAGDLFSPLPYYADLTGGVAMTRHELAAPLDFGAFNLVPYAWGEVAGWSNDFTHDSLSRVVGSAGVRGSMMMSKSNPEIQSSIFNLNGLTHKMVFDFDWSITETNRDISLIPQWNEFDDNAQERFRERLLVNTFGGTLPPQFDPRNFAIRSGAGSSVTAPYHELVNDMHVVRFGWRHRLQTKVGPPERLRTKDWMTLDLDASLFPDSSRDNFGKSFGLLGARYAWHVGDRTSILSNAYYDLFGGAMQLWNVGVLNQRSERGSLYAGVRQVKGQGFKSEILTASASYAMSEKWISTVGTAYDLAEGRNRGQSLTLTRVGADFLIHFGTNIDPSKNNFGVGISVEPRFGGKSSGGAQSTQLSNLLGIQQR